MLLDFDRMGWPLRVGLIGVGVLTSLFLIAPIAFIVALSFGSSQWLIFPPPDWTLEWYRQLLAEPGWLDAAWASFKVACLVTVLSVNLGFITSLALVRGTFRGRAVLRAFFLTPMVLPVVVLAVGRRDSRCATCKLIRRCQQQHGQRGRLRRHAALLHQQ